ncbi:hypothetical protein [Taibaiella chishuiensis]|uniref:Uncharacterized protein n=1 Tax=Taibaiella chishuiensis TaxID=1434707 RepID=A0A2P8D5P6_9BACT|nr:hypothetical protein [Taibaiella chishuiensis]PSK92536.1 hypothetical protein B0I18_103113 [Taibaiella chishuiensis]
MEREYLNSFILELDPAEAVKKVLYPEYDLAVMAAQPCCYTSVIIATATTPAPVYTYVFTTG